MDEGDKEALKVKLDELATDLWHLAHALLALEHWSEDIRRRLVEIVGHLKAPPHNQNKRPGDIPGHHF